MPDYQQVKEIVLDVIHTSEGKKVIQDLMKDPEFKAEVMLQSQEMEKVIGKTFTDDKTKKEWEKILAKPDVANNLAKASEKQQQQLMKTLMKDPEYQKAMLDLLKDPEFGKHILQLMKSQENRQATMKLIEETLKTPSFQDRLKKIIQETQGGQKGGQSGGPDSGGGGDGGDGGSGGGDGGSNSMG
jgi:spore germination protein D